MLLTWIQPNFRTAVAFVALLVVSNTGCSTLVWNKPKSQFDTTQLKIEGYDVRALSSQSTLAAMPPSDKPSIVLEVHHNGKHLERIPLPTDRPWFVQDLINEAEIQKRIGVTDIRIVRPTAVPGPPQVLDVPVSVDGKEVNAGQNYALAPGDLVIIKANNVGIIERMIPAYFRNAQL